MPPTLASSVPSGHRQVTRVGYVMLRLIRKAGLAVALAAALAAVAVAPSQAAGTRPRPAGAGVSVENVWVPVPGQHAVPAYLVKSAGALAPSSHAGILFLHWLGQLHGGRAGFPPEAIGRAPPGGAC